MNPSSEKLEKVLDLIYDAAAENDLWRDVLTAIADLTDSQGAIRYVLAPMSRAAQQTRKLHVAHWSEWLVAYYGQPRPHDLLAHL